MVDTTTMPEENERKHDVNMLDPPKSTRTEAFGEIANEFFFFYRVQHVFPILLNRHIVYNTRERAASSIIKGIRERFQ